MNVVYPGPSVGGNTETHPKLADMVVARARAGAAATASAAAEGGTACNFLFGGVHPKTGDYYANYHLEGGGWGAKSYDDGNDAIIVKNGNCRNTPVEIFETRYPLRTRRVLPDRRLGRRRASMRGGLGTRRILRVERGRGGDGERAVRPHEAGLRRLGPGRRRQGRARRDPASSGAGDDEFRTFSEVYGTRLAVEVHEHPAGGRRRGADRVARRRRLRRRATSATGSASARDVYEGFVSPGGRARALRLARAEAGRLGGADAEVWETVVTPCDCCGQVVAKRSGGWRSRASSGVSAAAACEELYREYVLPKLRAGDT